MNMSTEKTVALSGSPASIATRTLALCVIAGNVESYIERFIKSFQQLTPHIYIVRATGSLEPDLTLAKARAMGAVVGIYDNEPGHVQWPHVDNFGAARRAAFQMAKEDGHDFLIWADTDDVIDPESAQAIRAAVEEDDFDLLICPYRLTNNSLTPYRERVVRSGVADWVDPIHEHLEPLPEHAATARRRQLSGGIITHLPAVHREDRPSERNRRILESFYHTDEQHREPRWSFYLCQEYEVAGNRAAAILTATQGIQGWLADRSKLQPCEAYELYLLLAKWSEDLNQRVFLYREAWALEPWRREALFCLATLFTDIDRGEEAIALARMAMALPVPKMIPWTHRGNLYNWLGVQIYCSALRISGGEAEAIQIEDQIFAKGGKKITVIHPVRGRIAESIARRQMYFERAKDPQGVEYIFSFPEDDLEACRLLRRFRHVTSAPEAMEQVGGTYVQNMNAAYCVAQGSVIVGAADDVEPPMWWDEQILQQIGQVDKPAVLAVRDGFRNDELLVTHVFTRSLPSAIGLPEGEYLSSEYRGLFSDTEFTHRAKTLGLIKPSTITFLHHHPYFKGGETVPWDETYAIMNSLEATEFGRAVFQRRNPEVTL